MHLKNLYFLEREKKNSMLAKNLDKFFFFKKKKKIERE